MSSLLKRFVFTYHSLRPSFTLLAAFRPQLNDPHWLTTTTITSSSSSSIRHYSPSWGTPKPQIERKDIEFRVLKTLSKHDKIDSNSLSLSLRLVDELGLDSLDVIECIVQLEDEFQLEIADTEYTRLLSGQHFVDHFYRVLTQTVDENECPQIEFKEGMSESRPTDR